MRCPQNRFKKEEALLRFGRVVQMILFFTCWLCCSFQSNAQKNVTKRKRSSAKKRSRGVLQKQFRRALHKQTILSVYRTKSSGSLLLDALRSQKMLDEKLGSMPSFPFRRKRIRRKCILKKKRRFSLSLQNVVILGKLKRTKVLFSLRNLSRRLASCWREGRPKEMFLTGQIVYQWHIDRNGRSSSVLRIHHQHFRYTQRQRCISKFIGRAWFSTLAIDSAVTLQVSWVWSFD